MTRRITEQDDSVIVYDDDLLDHATPALFDLQGPSTRELDAAHAGGRAGVRLVRQQDHEWVLRHYHRGGLVGRLLGDRFAWAGASRLRPFSEWDLLATLTELGLPVPRPVAARCCRRGVWYTGDILTERLPGVESLAARWIGGTATPALWRATGTCIGTFHRHGVWHADLNAYNVQAGKDDRVYLLDFDRGHRDPAGMVAWPANLMRLERSLRKVGRLEGLPFPSAGWTALKAAHRAALSAGTPGPRAGHSP